MVALLELLITPYNNLSLATVLRSPLFACNDEALMQLAAMDKSSGNWYQRLTTLVQHDNTHPLHRAWQLLGSWRERVGRVPIHDLLDRIFNEGNVLARYQAAYPPHLRGRSESNLTRFLELALTIDSGRYPSLGRFLTRLGEMRENSDEAPDEAPASGCSERVRLMTIHASKGLEAPVVFIADSARASGQERPFRALIDWPASAPRPAAFLLVGKKGQQDSFTRKGLEHEQGEEQREDANLLYVALTRARQHLYLSACAPRKGKELGWYGAMREALDPLGETSTVEVCQLESGTPPSITEKPTTTENATRAEAIPEALSRPVTISAQSREIAPSFHHHGESRATFASSDEDGRQRGIAIHRLLELLTGNRDATPQAVIQRVALELGTTSSDSELLEWAEEAQQLLAEPALQEVLQPTTGEALNEVPIIYQQQGCTVHGVVDRLLLRDDEIWVVDYKTHRSATTEHHAELVARYQEQLRYYANGVSRLWPEKQVRTFLLFTHSKGLIETERNSEC